MAFVDLNIPKIAWTIERTIRHLKSRGVKKVFIATGMPVSEYDSCCREADGFVMDKVPDEVLRHRATEQAIRIH